MVYARFDQASETITFDYDTRVLNHLSAEKISIGSNIRRYPLEIYNTSNLYQDNRVYLEQNNSNGDIGLFLQSQIEKNKRTVFFGIDNTRHGSNAFIKTSNCDFYIATSNMECLRISNQGNIGIGTAFPRQSLDILQSVIIGNSLGIGTTIPRQRLDIQAGSMIMSGTIGVGTTIPRQRMDINNGNLIISGNVGIGTTIAKEKLYTIGNSLFEGSLTLANPTDTSRKITLNADTIIGSNLTLNLPNANINLLGGQNKRLGSLLTITGTVPVNPNMSFSLEQNIIYSFNYVLYHQADTLVDGISISVEYSGVASSMIYSTNIYTGQSSNIVKVFTASGGILSTTGVSVEKINYPIYIHGTISTSIQGTLRLSVACTQTSGSVQIIAGSYGTIQVI